VSSKFLESSCTLALGVFKVRVIIATYEAVFLGKKNSVPAVGRIVLLLGMCVYQCSSLQPLSNPIGGALGLPSAAIPSSRLL
jgi:hypothetical protein